MSSERMTTRNITGLALLAAMVVVLQLLGSFIHFSTFSVSLVLIPIVVGAALYGEAAGAWLGAVFGLVVLVSGDAALFMGLNPFATILVVMVKGIGCGWVSGIVYKALKQHPKLAVFAAAAACPVTNTLVFLLGTYAFFMELVEGFAETAGFTGNLHIYAIICFIGFNFVFELLLNTVLSPAIIRIIELGRRRLLRRKERA